MASRIDPLEMIRRLVAFDTTSRNPNRNLIAFCAEFLDGAGARVVLVPNADQSKVNLYATIGPDAPGGVVLSGHTDVVPVDGQPWSTDPWTVSARDGRLYGRGTADMKSFCAIAMALAPDFAAAGLKRPVHFAFSYDEEVGCLGVRPMIAHIADHLPKPALAIIGEPTMMRVVNSHKGSRSYEVSVTGREAHSSAVTSGVNAVMVAAGLIGELARIGKDFAARGDASGRFDPPYSTLQCCIVHGGTAANIIARECSFTWETRTLPGLDDGEAARRLQAYADALLPELRRIAPEAAIVVRERARVPPLRPDPDGAAETLLRALTGQNAPEAVSYATEAGLFQESGIPSVICGPGDIAQAHKPDEFIDLAQVDACAAFLRKLMRRLSD